MGCELWQDQHASLLQKDTGFDRLVSTTTAEPGAELPELKEEETKNHQICRQQRLEERN